jgi:hypothetical protein
VASFLRDSNEVTVLLGQGNVSMFQAENGTPVRVRTGEVSVVPVSGFKTLGEVAMLNGAVVVTAKEGMLRVQGNGRTVNVAAGRTITISPSAGAPQGGAGAPSAGGSHIAGATLWGVTDAALSGVGLVFSAVAMVRAGDAKTDASTASSNAAAAEAAAAAAASAANAAGCALNVIANKEGLASPYTPPAGYSCN